MRPISAAIVSACCLCVAAVGPAPASASCTGESAPATAQSPDQYELTLLCLVNERRAGHGKSALQTNPALTRAARRQSEAMVSRRFFGHRWPSGRSPAERVEDSGYLRGVGHWGFGENLGWGYGRQSTPWTVIENWMLSPPHREQLLKGRFRDIGISTVMGTPGTVDRPGAITVTNVYGFRER
jgi:uncharacterized protein YkwD